MDIETIYSIFVIIAGIVIIVYIIMALASSSSKGHCGIPKPPIRK